MIQVLTLMVLFTLISSTSDLLITNSDFLDNLYPYLESIEGNITFDNLALSNNAYFDVIAFADASFLSSSVVGNDLVFLAQQGDAVIFNSSIVGNALLIVPRKEMRSDCQLRS